MNLSRYCEARDRWIGEQGFEADDDVPAHACEVAVPLDGERVAEHDPTDTIHFEEFGPSGEPCGGYRPSNSVMSFGMATNVLAALSRLAPAHEWVVRMVLALHRERAWLHSYSVFTERRPHVHVFRPAGPKFHVSSSLNRRSITEHGLDWRLMGAARGVAGSATPQLPAIFVEDHLDRCDFFIRMAGAAVDVWSIDTDGLWAESGYDGWTIIPEPIPPDRLRLVTKDALLGHGTRRVGALRSRLRLMFPASE